MKKTLSTFSIAMTLMMFHGGFVQAEVSVGDQAPEFELVGSDGKTYTNKDFTGKKVAVIAWYPKAFTGG